MQLELLEHPFPFKASLAICSDIDFATSGEKVLEFQKYLCSDSKTVYGEGLGLEVGNSFWMFSDNEDQKFTYFQGLTNKESSNAEIIRQLIKLGYFDVIHSFGCFDKGGYTRKHAEITLEEFNKNNLKVPVWVNHGEENNKQNIGDEDFFGGSRIEKKDYYNLDIIKKLGVKYIWIGHLTHIVGQGNNPSIRQSTKLSIENFTKPKIFRLNSTKLLFTFHQDRKLLYFPRFVNRYGKMKNADFNYIAEQLTKNTIDCLINRKQSMILYTHFNENIEQNSPTFKILKYLKYHYENKSLLVTTTSKLLEYKNLIDNILHKIDGTNLFFILKNDISYNGLSFILKGGKINNIYVNNHNLTDDFNIHINHDNYIYYLSFKRNRPLNNLLF